MGVLHLDKRMSVIFLTGALACFVLGIIIGHFATNSGSGEERIMQGKSKEFVKKVMDTMDPTSIREFLEKLSKEPHIAASERDRQVFTKNRINQTFTNNTLPIIC